MADIGYLQATNAKLTILLFAEISKVIDRYSKFDNVMIVGEFNLERKNS